MSVFCSQCLHYEGGPPRDGRFDEDSPVHDDCNTPENQEQFTDYFGTRTRFKQLPGKINEQNNCPWYVNGASYIPPE